MKYVGKCAKPVLEFVELPIFSIYFPVSDCLIDFPLDHVYLAANSANPKL